ncbi:hypothetical protein AMEX_G970, partial [Astyanax mexicanus]
MCPRRVPVHLQGEVAVHLQDMEKNNIISRSQSPWAAPVVLVRKKDDQVQYLGHIISAEGVAVDPAKTEAVQAWPEPVNVREVRSFVGLASYYRRFVSGFAELARPLHKLTKKGVSFKWTQECQTAFQTLKDKLVSAPILTFPDPGQTFILDTDASDVAIGAILSQKIDGFEKVVAYASRALSRQEKNYATTKKELLAVVHFTSYFRHYLLGRRFLLRTDHSSLRWLHNFSQPEGQLARWLEQLAQFDYEIEHRPGKKHVNADSLSRRPIRPASLTCTDERNLMNEQEGGNVNVSRVVSSVVSAEASQGATAQLNCSSIEEASGQNYTSVQEHVQESTLSAACHVQEEQVEDWDLASAQEDDADIQKLKHMKVTGNKEECVTGTPTLKRLLELWDQLEVERGLLVRSGGRPGYVIGKQVVLPNSWVPRVLYSLHNTLTGGHLGVAKLRDKVRRRFFWPGWSKDVKEWCRVCEVCATHKIVGKTPRAPLMPSVATRPFQRIALDIVGPLPVTATGNKYILVIADYFSKWAESYAIPNQEATTVARAVVDFLLRWGMPQVIHTDQGRTFESSLFKEICRLLEIDKTRTSPYSPQSDGLVERLNRTIIGMLASFVEANQNSWDTLLPFVMMAYRSSSQASTKFSPYEVLLGREIRLPIDVVLGLEPEKGFSSVSEYVQSLGVTLNSVHTAVQKHLGTASGKQKEYYDLKVSVQQWSEGERVWVRDTTRTVGKCPKFQKKYKGPFVIEQKISDALYRIKGEGQRSFVVHHNRLKPCFDSGTLGTDPVEDELGTQLLEETDLVRPFAPEQPPRQPSRSFVPEQPPRQLSRSFAPEQPPRQPPRSFAPEQPPRQPSRSFAPEQPPRQPSRSFAPEQPPRQPSRSFAPEQPPRQPSRSFAPEQPPRQPSRSFAPEQPPRQPPRSFAPELPRPPSGPSEPEHWQSLPKSQV